MPRLLRGIARTAVVAGTATAVAGRVRRHQDQHFAERDAQSASDEQGEDQDDAAPQQVPEQRSAPASEMLDQLKQLGELRDSGVLTEQEFAEQKARILAG